MGKEMGFDRMAQDFRRKISADAEQQERMRTNFEKVIERMDLQIANNERDHLRKLKPWQEMVEIRDEKILGLERRLEEQKKVELENRRLHDEEDAILQKELAATKKAVDIYATENTKLRRQLDNIQEVEAEKTNWGRKIQRL